MVLGEGVGIGVEVGVGVLVKLLDGVIVTVQVELCVADDVEDSDGVNVTEGV